jgi:lipid A 3-O-deacylase
MLLRKSIIAGVISITVSQLALSQRLSRAYTKEISVITDNDNYLIQKRDGYYTNGFYFSFQHLVQPKDPRTQKATMRYELGQMIFNPYKYSITDPENMDRPFAGYLYLKATRSRFFAKGNNLQYGLAVGVIGPASRAEQVQKSYHNLINIYEVRGWGYQLKNEAGLNLYAQYTHPISAPPGQGQIVDLHAVARANLGNTFTNATAGLLFRIGPMERSSQSVLWNSRLHSSTPGYIRRSELFLFFQPEIMVQGYNATLQGGLFRNDKGPVIATLQPVLYQQKLGIAYAKGRFSVVVADVHRTREAKHMRRKENYGSIQVSYRLQ